MGAKSNGSSHPQWGFTDVGDQSNKLFLKLKKPAMKMMCRIYVHHSPFMYAYKKSTSRDARVQVYSTCYLCTFVKIKTSFKIKKNRKPHLCPTNTYILYKYIHKYILHTTAINLKRGIYRARGGVVVSVLACVVKYFVPVWFHQSYADVVLCVFPLCMHALVSWRPISWPSRGSCRSSTCWLGSSAAGCWTDLAGLDPPEHTKARL